MESIGNTPWRLLIEGTGLAGSLLALCVRALTVDPLGADLWPCLLAVEGLCPAPIRRSYM